MYLLDTHILIWWITNDKKLPAKYHEIISDTNNLIYKSPVSLWEIAVKVKLGKLKVPKNFHKVIWSQGFVELALTIEHTEQVLDMENIHADPFDRLLVAQTKADELTLLTVDKDIRKYDIKVV